eukprot:scaffold76533_cov72-Phaeocystis_antarctica.AAC.3
MCRPRAGSAATCPARRPESARRRAGGVRSHFCLRQGARGTGCAWRGPPTLRLSLGTMNSSVPKTANSVCRTCGDCSSALSTSRSSAPWTLSCRALLISTAAERSRPNSVSHVAAGSSAGASTKPHSTMRAGCSFRRWCFVSACASAAAPPPAAPPLAVASPTSETAGATPRWFLLVV